MPETTNAAIEITGYNWVPDFAKGHVRDIRARWALEEAGIDYRMRLFNASEERPEAYLKEQPFAQVPALKEGDIQMFESGAIMLYIADKSDKLMPRDPCDELGDCGAEQCRDVRDAADDHCQVRA